MIIFVGLAMLFFFSVIAFWKGSPVIFMLAAAVSIMTGLYAPDALSSLNYGEHGVSIGLVLIVYAFVNLGLAYANLFRPVIERDEE